jgi:hypothetical protein
VTRTRKESERDAHEQAGRGGRDVKGLLRDLLVTLGWSDGTQTRRDGECRCIARERPLPATIRVLRRDHTQAAAGSELSSLWSCNLKAHGDAARELWAGRGGVVAASVPNVHSSLVNEAAQQINNLASSSSHLFFHTLRRN